MRTPSISEIKALSKRSGALPSDCELVLLECDCDFLLAEGFLFHMNRLTFGDLSSAKKEWLMQQARKWKAKKLTQTL
jgi:hypothetical protein